MLNLGWKLPIVASLTCISVQAAVVTIAGEANEGSTTVESFTLTATVADSVAGTVSGTTTSWNFPFLSLVGEVGGVQTTFTVAEIAGNGFLIRHDTDPSFPSLTSEFSMPLPLLTTSPFTEDSLTWFAGAMHLLDNVDPYVPLLGTAEGLISASRITATDGYFTLVRDDTGMTISDNFGGVGSSFLFGEVTVSAVPEPALSTLVLLGLGFFFGRRR